MRKKHYKSVPLQPISTAGKPPERAKKMKNMSFEARYRLELADNEFSRFYNGTSKIKKPEEESGYSVAQKELNRYKHKDAVEFAAMSWSWTESAGQKDLPRIRSISVPTFDKEDGIRAYYRVIAEKDGKYIALACHVNVHAFHRGDLRFVEVTDRTIPRGMESSSVIGKLFPGDILAVTGLVKKTRDPLEPMQSMKVHQETKCVWEVGRMTVITRKINNSITFGFLENKTAVAKGYDEVMNVILTKKAKYNTSDLFNGKVFLPQRMIKSYTIDFNEGADNSLEKKSCCFARYPKSLATIFSYEKSDEDTDHFQIGFKAFDYKDDEELFLNENGFYLDNDSDEEIVETCVMMGYSAANSVLNGRFDDRTFAMINPRKEGMIIRFSIDNPSRLPTEGRWNCNERITLKGRFGATTDVNAMIETAIADPSTRTLQIVARISRDTPKDLRFNNGACVVSQREVLSSASLRENFFKNLDPTSNGYHIIKALYGGPKIETDFSDKTEYVFPSGEKPVDLNEYQNDYVRKILSGIPMILASSPFGCGKSMTIVTAAIEIDKKNQKVAKGRRHVRSGKQRQVLVTQSNYASVNLVDIALKVKGSELKFMRYISEKNWKELPDNCRTQLDFPQVCIDVFKRWATGKLISEERQNERNLNPLHKDTMVKYLMMNKIRQPGDLTPHALKHYKPPRNKEGTYRPITAQELLSALRVFYDPDVIMVTADSLQGALRSDVFRNISTIQIDEASQVPEYMIMSLLSKYPRANFGLIGDIQQLPPYCESELTGKLKDFGIGNTMERALKEKMFPVVDLRYVYRCHPKITSLLSELFYDGKLISAVSEHQKNEFIMKRTDIWPNRDFPLVVVNNKSSGHKMGTSTGNELEKDIVKQIIDSLTQKYEGYQLKPSDIGVISFYAGQTALLTEALRGSGVKCGTVDSFQGSERDVMILCCTNDRISEFMQLSNRLNVAMSRAKQATIIIGNVAGLEKAKYWSTIVKYAKENDCVIDSVDHPFYIKSEKTNIPKKSANKHRRNIGKPTKKPEESKKVVQAAGDNQPKKAYRKRKPQKLRAQIFSIEKGLKNLKI